MMRALPFLLIALLLPGCGGILQQTDEERHLEQARQDTVEAAAKSKLKASYPAPPQPKLYDITVSGNGSISITDSDKGSGKIDVAQDEDRTANQAASASRDLDAYFSSIPVGAWVAVLFMVAVILVLCIYILKRTMIGVAADNLGAGMLRSISENLDRHQADLGEADPKSDEATRLRHRIHELQREKTRILARMKPHKAHHFHG